MYFQFREIEQADDGSDGDIGEGDALVAITIGYLLWCIRFQSFAYSQHAENGTGVVVAAAAYVRCGSSHCLSISRLPARGLRYAFQCHHRPVQ